MRFTLMPKIKVSNAQHGLTDMRILVIVKFNFQEFELELMCFPERIDTILN